MPLNVSYKNRIGYYTQTEETRKFKMWFCHANCACAVMYFYENEGKPMVQLCGFFSDIRHFKKCVDDGFFRGCSGFHFKQKEMDNIHWQMVKYMVKKGIKVTIE